MQSKEDINRIGKVISSVNELVKMGLLQKFTDEPNIYVYPVCLQVNDKKYMANWCQNILRVWCLNYSSKVLAMEGELDAGLSLKIELSVFSSENGDLICKYSEQDGLSYF